MNLGLFSLGFALDSAALSPLGAGRSLRLLGEVLLHLLHDRGASDFGPICHPEHDPPGAVLETGGVAALRLRLSLETITFEALSLLCWKPCGVVVRCPS